MYCKTVLTIEIELSHNKTGYLNYIKIDCYILSCLFYYYRSPKEKPPSICSQYPVLTILIMYLLFLLLMGIWKSRTFNLFYHKYFSYTSDDDDYG